MDTLERIMESALRSIMTCAIVLETGEVGPRVASQDIQQLCLAALNGKPLPQLWEPWNVEPDIDDEGGIDSR